MAPRDEFHRLQTGKIIYQDDPDYIYKMMKLGEFEPNNPLQKADILLSHARRLMRMASRNVMGGSSLRRKAFALQNEAKTIYFDLLRHKESLSIHRILAPLLTIGEAEMMIAKYRKYPSIKGIYRERLRVLGITPASKIRRWLWRGLCLCLLLLLLGLLFWFALEKLNSTKMASTSMSTSVTREYVNNITYIDELPDIQFDGVTPVHSNVPSDIADEVDAAHIPVHKAYLIQGPIEKMGYAIYEGDGHFTIRLLTGGTLQDPSPNVNPSLTQTGSGPTITPYQLNIARTAYAYYLGTHHDVPPDSLAPIQSMVPSQVPMNQIKFQPLLSPNRALTVPGQTIPFQTPDIEINLSKHTLSLVYNHQVFVEAPAGVGNQTMRTPTGTFTITDRIANHSSPVYGDYIFPLNHSSFAIHGTNTPSRIGNNESLGCIEVTNSVDDRLFSLVPVGTPVVISDNGDSGTQSPNVFR